MGSAGLFGDVWASWAELIINLVFTILLAPIYGIAGILLGKIISFGLISVFWKPYYVFNNGLHKSVWIYWRGMAPYYLIFAIFVVISLCVRNVVIDKYIDSFITLIIYGAIVAIPIYILFFLFLFLFTNGMKYFVARKPTIYHILQHLTFT